MKITDIKVTPPLGRKNRDWVLLKVLTGEGIEGLGEWRVGASVEWLKGILVGKDPLNINRLHRRMLDLKDPIQDGYMTVPDGPGLGIELDEEEIATCLPEGGPLWS